MALTPHDVSRAAMGAGQPIDPLIGQGGFTRARFHAGYEPSDDVQGKIRALVFTEVGWQDGSHPRDVDAVLAQLVG